MSAPPRRAEDDCDDDGDGADMAVVRVAAVVVAGVGVGMMLLLLSVAAVAPVDCAAATEEAEATEEAVMGAPPLHHLGKTPNRTTSHSASLLLMRIDGSLSSVLSHSFT